MTLEEAKEMIDKYIVPDRMYYIVAGDAASQMKALGQLGMGNVVLTNK
jgi:zinc protease